MKSAPHAVSCMLSLVLCAGAARAQCGNQALYELGGMCGQATYGGSTPIPQVSVVAVARGRFISFETNPLVSGAPQVLGRVGLDHPPRSMHSEFLGRMWATDGPTLYGIDCNNSATPSILGRITLPPVFGVDRVRVSGNFVYAIDGSKLYVIDVSTPAAPVLRASWKPATSQILNDLEVSGSFAYIAITENPTRVNSIMVVDISNPNAPVEVRRVGDSNSDAVRLLKSPTLSGFLYALSRNTGSGRIEKWTLTSPSTPGLLGLNTSLSTNVIDDEIRGGASGIVHLNYPDQQLRVFNSGTLASVGPTSTFKGESSARSMHVDAPYIFLPKQNGVMLRAKFDSSGITVPPGLFIDVPPGYTRDVYTTNEGFSILTGPWGDLWFFSTPPGAAPVSFAHVPSDIGTSGLGTVGALLSGGIFFTIEYGGVSPNTYTLIIAYKVAGAPAPGVQFQGTITIPGQIQALDAGYDAGGVRRVVCTTFDSGSSTATLRVINANNLGAMTQTGTFALGTGNANPVRFLPASAAPAQPARVLVGGPYYGTNLTQLISLQNPASPSILGALTSAADQIVAGAGPMVWVLDRAWLKGFDVTNPASPVLKSTTLIDNADGRGDVLRSISPLGNVLIASTFSGRTVKIDVTNPLAPSILQIATIGSDPNFPAPNGYAYDGTNIHIAGGTDGYLIYPSTFNGPPVEDPNHALRNYGTQGIVGVCPSTAQLSFTASFVANPPVTAYQWQRYNRTAFQWVDLANGPTGTGSTISGATTSTLTVASPGAADATIYRCGATNSCGLAFTDSFVEARLGGYANCDGSTLSPVLSASDFVCFLNFFRQGFSSVVLDYANCDQSVEPPTLTASDFICFLNKFRVGCQ